MNHGLDFSYNTRFVSTNDYKSNYDHKIKIPFPFPNSQICIEIANWIKANIDKKWDFVITINSPTYIVFNFESEIDAMHFMLRWK